MAAYLGVIMTVAECQRMAILWLVCVVAGTGCAVFYTQSRDNHYPRIGRRAFFTMGDKGSSYPRIGRSSPGPNRVISGSDTGFRLHPKRSGLTVSRGEGKGGPELPAPSADVMTSLEGQNLIGSDEAYWLPLGFLFTSFDTNGDQVLTREEFVQGMLSAREDGAAC